MGLNRLALSATVHCLTGCAIGAVLGLGDPRFWLSLAAALLIAGVAALPANRWLLARGRGHAVVHGRHEGSHGA